MHSCALTMAMLCGRRPKACASVLPAGSWIPLSGDRRAGKPLALLALISGENQTRAAQRGRRGDDGARRVRRVGQGPGRPVIIRRRVGGVENGASKTFVCAC